MSRCDRSPARRPFSQKHGRELSTQVLEVFWSPAHISCSSPWLPAFVLSCVLSGVSGPPAVLVCLSGMNGSTLWSSALPEEARDITCLDLTPGNLAKTVCLVTGTHKMLSAFNGTSGKDRWPPEVPAPGSPHLGLEQSGREGTVPLSHGGRSDLLLRKVDVKGNKRKGLSRVSHPWFNLFGDRIGLN